MKYTRLTFTSRLSCFRTYSDYHRFMCTNFVCVENFQGAQYGRYSSTEYQPLCYCCKAGQCFQCIDRKSTHLSDEVSKINSCHAADDKLFQHVTTDRKHVLHDLIPLPSVVSQNYNLCQRRHNLELPSKCENLRECYSVQRMLFLDCY